MRVLLMGYFGQRNMGDELTSFAAVRLATSNWDAHTFDLLNLATPSDADELDMAAMLPDCNFRRVWFDAVRRFNYDAVMVINSGWVHSFCIDVIAHVIDLGTPVYVLCAKNITDIREDGLCRRMMGEISARSKVFLCRFRAEAELIGGIAGLDPAEFINPPVVGRINDVELVYCPRWFEEDDARAVSAGYIRRAADDGAIILACNPYDAKLCEGMDARLVRGWEEPLEALRIISTARGIISGGRLHPVLLGSSFGVPCCVLDIQHDCHNRQKLHLLNKEMGVDIVDRFAWPSTKGKRHFEARATRTIKALESAGLAWPSDFRR